VNLSPVTAIQDMVAPVVLMTLATIYANGLLTLNTVHAQEVFALNRERMGILRGPHGEALDEESIAPADRERLAQIGEELPLIARRFGRIRIAVLTTWIAIGLFVLSVTAIAVAVTANSEGFAFAALALVLAGVALVFAAMVTVLETAVRWGNVLVQTVAVTLPPRERGI